MLWNGFFLALMVTASRAFRADIVNSRNSFIKTRNNSIRRNKTVILHSNFQINENQVAKEK